MQKLKITLMLFGGILAMVSACTRTEKTTAGIEFRYHREGGGDIVQPGQFLLLDLKVYDSEDSVWMDTYATDSQPQLVRVDTENPKIPDPGETGVYRRLAKGDSVSFAFDVATLYEQTWMRPVPKNLDRNMEVTYVVSVREIFDAAGMEAFRVRQQQLFERQRMDRRIAQFGRDTLLIDSLLGVRGKTPYKNESGIRYTVELEGKGASPVRGDIVKVFYQGYFPNGKIFDTNRSGSPLEVVVGAGRVIRGWDEMLPLMKRGGRYTIYLPSLFAYGDEGFPPDIPGNAILLFDMEIVSISKP